MSTLWLHSRQDIRAQPITTLELRGLAAEGGLMPNDLVLRLGTDRWLPAGKLEGLFNSGKIEWYFTHDGRTYGPVTLQQLWDAVGRGFLVPDDYVIRMGMSRWKSATKIVGLFPEPASSPGLPSFRSASVAPAFHSPTPAQMVADPDPVSKPTPSARGSGPLMSLAQHLPSLLFSVVLLLLAVAGSVWSLPAAHSEGTSGRERRTTRPNALKPEGTFAVTSEELEAAYDREPEPTSPPRVRTRLARLDRPAALPSRITKVPRDEPQSERSLLGAGDDSLPLAVLSAPTNTRRLEDDTLSPASERRLGQAMHNRLLRENPVLETDGLREQIERLTQPLLAHCRRTEIDFSVTVLDAPEPFAFSHLGGYVYVSRGMIDLAGGGEALSLVIAHELAHLELRHGRPDEARRIGEARLRGRSEASLAPTLLQLGANHHDPAEERACDAWVTENCLSNGEFPAAYLEFGRRYLAYLGRHADDRVTPSLLALDRHWNAAPSTIARLEDLLARTPEKVAR